MRMWSVLWTSITWPLKTCLLVMLCKLYLQYCSCYDVPCIIRVRQFWKNPETENQHEKKQWNDITDLPLHTAFGHRNQYWTPDKESDLQPSDLWWDALTIEWLECLTRDQKVAGLIPFLGSETFFWVCN